jgi:hypothetical protein
MPRRAIINWALLNAMLAHLPNWLTDRLQWTPSVTTPLSNAPLALVSHKYSGV